MPDGTAGAGCCHRYRWHVDPYEGAKLLGQVAFQAGAADLAAHHFREALDIASKIRFVPLLLSLLIDVGTLMLNNRAMAVSHRNAEYVIAINTGWADPQDTEKQIECTRDLWTAIRPFSSGGVYVNFLSEDDGEDRVRAAYGATKFERLVGLKRKYDPQNLFQMNKNIKPVS